MLVVGVDIETTGTRDTPRARLVQVGAAAFGDPPARWFSSLVAHPLTEMAVDPLAMSVHGIHLEEILRAPSPAQVDAALSTWLAEHGATAADPAVAVGWNVASFDLAFIAETLPHARTLLARRSIDLNAVCLALSGLHPGADFEHLKASSKTWAAAELERAGLGSHPHDACWDAAEAVLALHWLRSHARVRV